MDHQAIRDTRLDQAIRNVRKAATDGNTPGFMLVNSDSMGMGFSFLVCEREFCASLHAMPEQLRESWTYECAFSAADAADAFIEGYLQAAALNMLADYPRLLSHFAHRHAAWRFDSLAYGVPAQSQDNDSVWRVHLWPLVRRIVTDPPQCLRDMPSIMRGGLLKRLAGHATEGMLVLERTPEDDTVIIGGRRV